MKTASRIPSTVLSWTKYNKIVVVGAKGDYLKLSDALNAITDASQTNRYCVIVVGKVTDDATIYAKSYVDVVGFAADITVETDSNVHGVVFDSVVETEWRGITIRRTGDVSSAVYACLIKGTTDKTCKLVNCEFINEISAAVNGCHGIVIAGSALPSLVSCKGSGGMKSSYRPLYVEATTSITDENVGTGDGTTTTFYLDNPPVVQGSETIYVDGTPQTRDTDYTIDYLTGKVDFSTAPPDGASITADYTHIEAPFKPYAGKPYILIGIAVYVYSAQATGSTLRLGTTPNGAEIASGIPVDSTGWKYFAFNRVERLADENLYALVVDSNNQPVDGVPSNAIRLFYVVMTNYADCYGLYLDSHGYVRIKGGAFVGNGESEGVRIAGRSVSTKNWLIANATIETLDPSNEYSVVASSSLTDAPIYNCTLIGNLLNVTPSTGTSQGSNIQV